MARLDRRAAGLLAAVLALTALIGFGQGLVQALRAPRPEQVAAGVDPARDPTPNAAALAAVPMDEARVRQIAREEATAALGASRRRTAPPKAEDSGVGEDPAAAEDAAPSAAPPAAPSVPPAAASTPG